jgi:hypothetical protein
MLGLRAISISADTGVSYYRIFSIDAILGVVSYLLCGYHSGLAGPRGVL